MVSASNELVDVVELLKKDRMAGVSRLVAEYGDRLYETAIRLCGNAADAEDYAFRTLERAVTKIDTFRGGSSIFTWLYEILVNQVRSDLRRKAANALDFMDSVPEQADPRPEPTDALAREEEAAAVRASLEKLPYVLREIVVFRYWEDLTVPEIAKILAIPEGTVKSRLYHAKNLMRTIISRTIDGVVSSKEVEGYELSAGRTAHSRCY